MKILAVLFASLIAPGMLLAEDPASCLNGKVQVGSVTASCMLLTPESLAQLLPIPAIPDQSTLEVFLQSQDPRVEGFAVYVTESGVTQKRAVTASELAMVAFSFATGKPNITSVQIKELIAVSSAQAHR